MATPESVLRQAHTVAMVDWPSARLPAALVRAGFEVVSFNRPRNTAASYAWHAIREEVPEGAGVTVIPVGEDTEGYLAIAPLAVPPSKVDILSVFRPPDELPGLARLAIELGAAALWLQGDVTSQEARTIAEAAGLLFVDDADLMITLNRMVE